MRLTATEFLTLDGMYQGPGAPDEDRRNGFDRGGWQAPYGDDESGAFITAVYERMDAMLLGRTTFEIQFMRHSCYRRPRNGGDQADR